MGVEMTLAEKVSAVMQADDRNPVDRGVDLPFAVPRRQLSTLELDARDWRLYYGVAIGLARTEEACEPIESVVERARAAASEVFAALNNDSPALVA